MERNPIHTAKWAIRDGLLQIQLANGERIIPSAREIFGAEFHGNRWIRGSEVPNTPSADVPSITISRYAVTLRLQIRPPKPGLAEPAICCVVGTRSNISVEIPQFSESMPDHVIAERTWFPIAFGDTAEIGALLASAGVRGTGRLSLRQYLNLVASSSELIDVNESLEDPNPGKRVTSDSFDSEAIPAFTGKLYPYQQDGYRWLSMIGQEDIGCILADEMGLGKTIQAIAFLANEKALQRGPSLVVAPTTILENWRRELAKFSALTCLVHRGPERTGFPSRLKEHDLTITSYDTLVRDIPLFKMVPWNVVILDEAQAVKNPYAQRTLAAKQMPRRVSVAVTGTPLENHLTDLWSIVDFAVKGLLGKLEDFEGRYSDTVDGAASLERIVSPIMLRRTVQAVAGDLPDRIVIPQPVELDDIAAETYEALRRKAIQLGAKGLSLASLAKLRMFCAHPFLIDPGVAADDPASCSMKYTRLLEVAEEFMARSEKALVFTSFTKMVDILVKDLAQRYGMYCDYIDGRVQVTDRQKKVDAFSECQPPAILILNPRAAGIGLNIFAANHVIHYNPEWNPAVEDQASARAYRRGQTRPVTIHQLFYANTVEEIMVTRMAMKRTLTGTAVVGHSGRATDLAEVLRALELSPVIGLEKEHDRRE